MTKQLDEFHSLMQNVHLNDAARTRINAAVADARAEAERENAQQEAPVRGAAHAANATAHVGTPRAGVAHPRPHVARKRPPAKRRFGRAAAIAACTVALAVGVGAFGVLGTGGSPLSTDNAKAFALEAYAQGDLSKEMYHTTTLTENSLTTNVGGYFGHWENLETGTMLDDTLGYRYSFDLTCIGSNVASYEYTIESDGAYFAIVDINDNMGDAPTLNKYRIVKTLTIDAENERDYGVTSDGALYIPGIAVSLPMDAEFQAAYDYAVANKNTAGAGDALDWQIETHAAQRIAQCKLHVTATFTDGTTATKTYVIAPVDNFEEQLADYNAAREEARTAFEQQGQTDLYDNLENPELYTITEIDG